MKTILLQLREWLGLSQSEMAVSLNISRSLLAMAETGKRSLSPETTHLVLALYECLKHAPPNETTHRVEKEVLAQLLLETENQERFAAAKIIFREKRARFREPFPEREFQLPAAQLSMADTEENREILINLAHYTRRRLYRYGAHYTSRLQAELERVRCQAAADYLRTQLHREP